MAEHHLVNNLLHTVGNVERSAFHCNACVENHVIKQVSDFLGCRIHIAFHYGVAEFVDLFFSHRPD